MAKHLALIVAMLFIPALAKADSVWTYAGNTVGYYDGVDLGPTLPPNGPGFYPGEGYVTVSPAMSGTVLLNDSFQAIAWSFTMDSLTLTNFNSTASFFPFNCFGCNYGSTPNNGDNTPFETGAWKFVITGSGVAMLSQWRGSTLDARDEVDAPGVYDVVQSDPGTWTEAVSTPEPGSLLLLAAGLAALALAIHARGNRWTIESLVARFN